MKILVRLGACLLVLAGAIPSPARAMDAPTLPRQVPQPTLVGPLAYVPNPVITGPELPGPVHAGVRTTVRLRVQNVKAGTVVKVTPLAAGEPTCVFLTPVGMPPVTVVAGPDNGAMVTVPGQFSYRPPGSTAPCIARFRVDASKLDGTAATVVPNFANVQLAAPAIYVLTSTSDWLDKFSFSNTSASGECSGISGGPAGQFRVGLLTSEGSQTLPDITFKIRSGPLGTRCLWKSQPFLLPEGVRLTQIETGQDLSGPCSVSPTTTDQGGFVSLANPVMAGSTRVGANPLGAGMAVTGIGELTVSLRCGTTLGNDRFATLTIKSLTFEGPPGLTGFP